MYIKPAHGAHSFPVASNSSMARHGSGLYLIFGYFVHHGFVCFFCIRFDFLRTIALKYYLSWWLTFSTPTSMCTPSQCLLFLTQLPAPPKCYPHLARPPRVWLAARGHIRLLATFPKLTTPVSIPISSCFLFHLSLIALPPLLCRRLLFKGFIRWQMILCDSTIVNASRYVGPNPQNVQRRIESECQCQLRTWGAGDASV